MIDKLEYMQLASTVYAASDNNKVGTPAGWTELAWQADTWSGFSAGTFIKGNEVVIAYTGTNDFADKVNWAIGLGMPLPQVYDAMRYYFNVRKAYPTANITFTGHSLGGGLASLMAVFFDKQATVFDQAPFQPAALSGNVLAAAAVVMLASGYVDSSFTVYLASMGLLALSRESNVTQYSVEGEVLSYIRFSTNTLVGADHVYGMGTSTASKVERHSMALLTALQAVPAFHEAVKRIPFLVTELMDATLFAADIEDRRQNDILRTLLRHQLGVTGAITPDDMLKRFTKDVDKVTQAGGLTMSNEYLTKALVAFAMQMYNTTTIAADKTLFRGVNGGIRFERDDIAATLDEIKGYTRYFTAFLDTLGDEERSLLTGKLPELRDWFIQAGSGDMSVTAEMQRAFMLGGKGGDALTGGGEADALAGGGGGDTLEGMGGDDVLIGGDGADDLCGGEGKDVLVGGDGDDTFEGGAAADELKGGDGYDTYNYHSGQGSDQITDSDGEIVFNGSRLDGGKKKKDETVYWSSDKKHSYEWDGGDLLINNSILVVGFNNRDLGIYLDEEGDPEEPDYDPNRRRIDPLALDLDGNGKIDTIASAQSSAYFDFNGDGIAERSGWIAAADGLLVLDANDNGAIDNLSELFGTAEVSGFADLKQRLDSNGDNNIDAGDEKFAKLRVWRDSNGDGIAQETDIRTLEQLGITSIGLDATEASIADGDNMIVATGTFQQNGQARLVADVELAVNFTLTDSNPVRALNQNLTRDADIGRLPWLRGYGLVRTLPDAYQDNLPLRQAAAALAGLGAHEILAGFDAFFVKWSGLEAAHQAQGVTRAKLSIEDKVWMLETLMGQDIRKSAIQAAAFGPLPSEVNPQWDENYINGKYIELVSRAALSFAMQSAGKELLDGAYYSLAMDKFVARAPARLQAGLQTSLNAITSEDEAGFAAMVLARLKADGVNLAAETMKQGLSESPFAQIFNTALDFNGKHVSSITSGGSFGAFDNSGWFMVGSGGDDEIIGAAGDDVLSGGYGNDWLDGGAGKDALSGGAGDDWLQGGAGNDVYLFERGDGADVIYDYGDGAGNTDTIRFGAGIAAGDVIVRREESDLYLSLAGSLDRLTVQAWFGGDGYKVEWVEFADGTVWGVPELLAATAVPTEGADYLGGASNNDALTGLGGNDTLFGEAGDDTLDGGAGDDLLQGGAGNDVYLFERGDGADVIYDYGDGDGAGNTDTIRFGAGIAAGDVIVRRDQSDLYLSIAGSPDRLTVRDWFYDDIYKVERVEFADGTVWGVPELLAAAAVPTEGADYLDGASNNDALTGLGGNDTLLGEAGDDTLDGGAGDDSLQGGAGNDVYLFERGDGADAIYDDGFGAGNTDTIRFGAGIAAGDVIVRRDQSDLYLSLAGSPDRLTVRYWFYGDIYKVERVEFADGTVWGVPELLAAAAVPTEDADYLDGASNNDALTGLGGNDTLLGEAGDDTLDGGAGDDSLQGGAGNDVYLFERGDGADAIYEYDFGAGNTDTIRFGAGIAAGDVIVRRDQSDLCLSIAGGPDRLTVRYWFYGDIYKVERVEFADGTVWGVPELLAAAAVPTAGADYLDGASNNDALTGLGGNDTLLGDAGDDTLDGGAGDDLLQGGAGNDVYLFERGDGADAIYDDGDGAGNTDTIRFGAGIAAGDVIVRRDQSDLCLSIAGGPDRLTVRYWVYGDIYKVERVEFADGTVWGVPELLAAAAVPTEGADYLDGASNNDALTGLGGNDTLLGEAGDDTLDGGDGDDYVAGGAGDDILYGGAGDDQLRDWEGGNAVDGGDGNDGLFGYGNSNGAAPAYFIAGGRGNDDLHAQGAHYVVGFNAGDGQDTVDARYLDAALTLSFGGGIAADALELSIDGGDVILGTGGGDSIRLEALSSSSRSDRSPITLQIIGSTIQTYDFNAVLAAFEAALAQGAPGAAWPLAAALASHVRATSADQAIGGQLAYRYARDGSLAALAPEAIRSALSSEQFGLAAQHFTADVNIVDGSASDDALLGADGSDALSGNTGNDTLDGGLGNDTYMFNPGDGVDRIVDAGGADTIQFGVGIVSESLSLGMAPGSLLLNVGTGGEAIYLDGFDPNNALGNPIIEQILFSDGTILSAEQLIARGFDISGSGAISGTSVRDLITGGNGADTITGGKGDDFLNGDAGNDAYLFNLGDGIDTLYDMATDLEGNRIVFGAGIVRADLRFERNNGAVILRYSAADAIALPQFDLSGANGTVVVSLVEFADGSTVSLAELAAQKAVALADDGGAIGAGGVLTLSAESLLANDITAGGSRVIVGVAARSAAGAEVSFLNGNVTYDTASVFQNLGEGDSRTDTFTYAMAEAPGATITGAATVTVTVTGSNDAPIMAQALGDASLLQGRLFRFAIPGNAFADVDGGDTLTYSVTAADGGALPGWLSFDAATATLQGRPADGDVGVLGIKVVATDRAGAAASSIFSITVLDVNDAPVLSNPIAPQSVVEGDLFSYTLAANAFTDPDVGDTLSYSAQLANGDPLPAWLTFSAATRTLSGTPDANAIGDLRLRVTAADQRGYESAGTFDVTVLVAPDKILIGASSNDSLAGLSGNDMLDGAAGSDTMRGKRGNDTYVVDNRYDSVIEYAGEGTDTVQASVSYSLGSNVENLVLTGTLSINGTGNSLNNALTGNSGNNTLNGGTGADTLIGRAGNDTYVVDNAGDVVLERASEGTDLVQSGVTYTLGADVENLALTGTLAINGGGNELDNVLTGNSAVNAMNGGAGNDSLNGGAGADRLTGGLGDDSYVVDHAGDVALENAAEGSDSVQSSVTFALGANVENLTLTGTLAINGAGNELDNVLTGNSGANSLNSGAGNDTLNGAAGADTLAGGAGNDTYVVDNVGDVVLEQAGEGADLVQSSLTYTLGGELENLTLTGGSAINGTGNALANIIIGNAGNNILNGGAGGDTLAGGAGNDTYVVNDAGDTVSEAAGAGTDLVQSSLDYTLGANVENLILTGTGAIGGTGNALVNVITGNSADNLIDGNSGADTLAGGGGNDTYIVDNVGDVVLENAGGGTDLAQASVTHTLGSNVENLTLTGTGVANGTGNTLDNFILGNSADNILNGAVGADTLAGGAGNDTLDGAAGADRLTGGTGDDVYVVDNVGDVVTEYAGEGTDLVQSSATHTLAAYVDNLTLTGTLAINGTGNAGDNLIKGNGGNNSLNGGAGNDVIQAGAGADTLTDTNGNNLLDGGAGNDTLAGGSGNDFLIGGAGNDTITSGTGTDVIAFSRGDGQDVVNASAGSDNTLALGHGITYADLLFNKSGNDLVLATGSGEQVTFRDWYASVDNHSVANLQIVIEGTADYIPASGNQLNDNKIEQFDFDGLADAFDQTRTLNPLLINWSLSASLLDFHLSSSDTAAIGGDLAYQNAKFGALSNLSLTQAQALLADPSFGTTAHALYGPARSEDLSLRLL